MNIKKIKKCIEKIVYKLYSLSGHPHKLLSILNASVSFFVVSSLSLSFSCARAHTRAHTHTHTHIYMLRIRWRELLRMQRYALKNITPSLYESNITHSCNFIHLQHSPLDDHSLRICLIKNLPRKNPVGKNQWRRKKSTVFLCHLECLRIASLKPCKGKPSGKKLQRRKKSTISTYPLENLLPLMSTQNFHCSW